MINEATEPKCWAHRHMSYTDYGILNVVTAWAYQKSAKVKGTLFFDGLRISNEFSDGCKGTIYKFRDRMVTAGWLIPMDPVVIDPKTGLKIAKRNKRNGKLSSERYRVLKHEEWAAAHPGACELCRAVQHDEEPVHLEGMDGTESSSPRETGPVHPDVSPVHPEGTVQFTQTSHQFTQEDITGKELVLGTRAKTRREEQVSPSGISISPSPLLSMPSSGGPQQESEADSGRSASSPRETGPVHLERLVNVTPPAVRQGVVLWRGVDEGYVDSITGRKLFFDDLNARIAPNKYENAKFWNPAGEEISLEQAQEKEAVCA